MQFVVTYLNGLIISLII